MKDWVVKNVYFASVLYCILAALALGAFILRLVRGREKPFYSPVIGLILILLFPICCNIISLMVPGVAIYLLMAGGMMMTIPLLIALTDLNTAGEGEKKPTLLVAKILRYSAAVVAALLVWTSVLACQTDASVMQVNKNQTIALAGRIWQQIEAREDYVPHETPVLIIGHPNDGNYPNPSPLVDKANVYATWGTVWRAQEGNMATWSQIYQQYLGVAYQSCSLEDALAISQSEEFQQMPLYPASESIAWVNGVLVVKIADMVE